jgi:cytosine/uracil/thiamine/allantoin permease
MIAGTIYIVFASTDFLGPFQGFLITLGVPIAGWAGVMIADVATRRGPYVDADLYTPRGRYGSVNWPAVALVVVGSGIGWGLVTNASADWLKWQGYLLEPFGLGGKDGNWAFANLGVLASLAIGFVGWLLLHRTGARRAAAVPASAA